MDVNALNTVAKKMVAPGKGILAADESFASVEKKFAKYGIPSTEDTRREYRQLFFTAPGIGDSISGVILFDETIKQSSSGGMPFVKILEEAGVMPGIKVDEGLKDMDASPLEKVTKGLDTLPARLSTYVSLGATFAKWRAVITIGEGLPTDMNIRENARILAGYAMACQEAGLVPMVEPEVLMDGTHTIEACQDASERTLAAVFEEITKAGVAIEGMILKTNMIVPGKEKGKAAPSVVAEKTVAEFKKLLPAHLPGQAFLSGGQSEIEATENLQAINALGPHPWNLSFSYGRALQDSALKTWNGKTENVPAAQAVFLKRAHMNSLATLGKYTGENS